MTPVPTDPAPGIRTEGLSRRFGGLLALDNLDLAVRPGEIYAFLGANGAGKSTAMRMMVGLLEPTAGRVWIGATDLWASPEVAKRRLGYLAERVPLYERLTGREYLEFLAQLRELDRGASAARIDHLLDELALAQHAARPCGDYSYGMKRKLGLAAALLHEPDVLILDEPLSGLDPPGARRMRALFGRLAAEGRAVLISTHDLTTAESVCHRVGILDRGRLVAEGSALELRVLAAAPDLEAAFLDIVDRGSAA